jgi:hypothetical protein
MKVSKSCLRRNASSIIFLWVRLVFALYAVDAFDHPVASSSMSCCGIPTLKLRIILMKFLVMCMFGWVFLAALIMY